MENEFYSCKIETDKVNIDSGLTTNQVKYRKENNLINKQKIGSSKTVGKILFSNIFTFFNLLILLVFIWLLTITENFNDLKNTTFMFVAAVNTLIGIVQELRAKHTMDNLSLLSSPDVNVLRENITDNIKLNEILIDDVIMLSAGNQICSDAILREGELEVNEAMLTGESLPIKKVVGDSLLSGSFVVSGKGKCQVCAVGSDNYIQKLTEKAKEVKENKSELIRSIKLIMKVIAFAIIPIAILTFLNNINFELAELNNTYHVYQPKGGFFEALPYYNKIKHVVPKGEFHVYKEGVTLSSTPIIGMIPVGMFLLTSVALAVGILRLSKKKALVQDLYSIEALARVNMLCLDKTGTLTDGTMVVKEIVAFDKKINVEAVVTSMQLALNDNNQTAIALKDYFKSKTIYKPDNIVPFSSERKVSAVRFLEEGYFVLGAPEYVCETLPNDIAGQVNDFQHKGNRCLLLAVNKTKLANKSKNIPSSLKPVALIVIEDNIKSDAIETLQNFKNNNVNIRVISGDNPITVSEVAKRVGIDNAEKYLSLQNLSDNEIRTMALDYTVFGRVNPQQKKLLIQIFKEAGNTVAMTGDGVNDILALKEADCSIAMANGSEATRNVSQIVLLDSNFGSMPSIVNEGRRVINNVERSSALFLNKTIFSFLLMLLLIMIKMQFPIQPIHLTFTSSLVIGIASFVLAMEPNKNKIKGKFLHNIMKKVIPSGLALTFGILFLILLRKYGHFNVSEEIYATTITVTIFSIFMILLYNISKPFNMTRGILFVSILVIAGLCLLIMPMFPLESDLGFLNFFKLSKLTGDGNGVKTIAIIISIIFFAENFIKLVEITMNKIEEMKAKSKNNKAKGFSRFSKYHDEVALEPLAEFDGILDLDINKEMPINNIEKVEIKELEEVEVVEEEKEVKA